MLTRSCTRCILTSSDEPSLTFDEQGVCSICDLYDERKDALIRKDKAAALKNLIHRIKEDGKHAEYDCIVGLSGGVDSTYVACLAKQHGLRPLAVHLDNGWNSELAIINIQRILDSLQIDLYTYVIDWEEFRQVISGNGPCNAERIAARKKAEDEGQWVRDAAIAFAEKRSAKKAS